MVIFIASAPLTITSLAATSPALVYHFSSRTKFQEVSDRRFQTILPKRRAILSVYRHAHLRQNRLKASTNVGGALPRNISTDELCTSQPVRPLTLSIASDTMSSKS